MKKILCFLLCGLLTFPLSSCFQSYENDEINTPERQTETTLDTTEPQTEESSEIFQEETTQEIKPVEYLGANTHTPLIPAPSKGIAYISREDGTCYVSGIGSCTDTTVVIPGISPEGDIVTSIGKAAFQNCNTVTEMVLPSSIMTVGSYAFSGCSALVSINIPGSVISIGKYAFEKCTLLTEITLPDSLKYLGEFAFSFCLKLERVTISSNVESIGIDIFYDCSKLKAVTYGGTKQQWILLSINSQFACISGYKVICSDGEMRFPKG